MFLGEEEVDEPGDYSHGQENIVEGGKPIVSQNRKQIGVDLKYQIA